MPRRDGKPSTGTWLSDALTLFTKYYRSRQLAERKLADAMVSGRVRWDCQEYEGRLGYSVGDPRFWKKFWGGRPRALRALKWEDASAEFFTKLGRSALWGIWVPHEDLLVWLREEGLTLLPEDMPAPVSNPVEPASAPALEPVPKASQRKRRGRQIDRVYRELRVRFPPDGKAPALMTIDAIRAELLPGWKDENKKYLSDPSPDVVAAAVKEIGRRAD